MKPLVNIKDCFIFTNWEGKRILTGIPLDYPDTHQYRPGALRNGERVYTTAVVSETETMVETQRTLYSVQNWLTETEYETAKTSELHRRRVYY